MVTGDSFTRILYFLFLKSVSIWEVFKDSMADLLIYISGDHLAPFLVHSSKKSLRISIAEKLTVLGSQ